MKIIISNKCREHMQAHESEFLVSFEYLIKWGNKNNHFDSLKEDFEVVTIDFPFVVGLSVMFKTNENDEIVYAKRIGRDTYTRFVKGRKPYKVKSCSIFLKKNNNAEHSYYLVTMFPGEPSVKEPFDKNIKSREELRESLEFWTKHALLFNSEMITPGTETKVYQFEPLRSALS